jgi:phosphoribosyl 1,2-cyclic phosphodiesterase
MEDIFNVRFWGVRGTIPVADKHFMQYGGNTSCIEVNCGDQTFILDAGTGIHTLGQHLAAKQVDILFSHSHIDHICGLPFFGPMYDKTRRIDLWAGHLKPEYDLLQVIKHIMAPPIFPITPMQFHADIHYHDFTAGDDLRAARWLDAGVTIKTLALNHPDRATGYRIDYKGKSLCYITDIEHTPGMLSTDVAEFVRGATCFIYDSTYCDEEFTKYIGWGHSTWQQAVRIADYAHVQTLVTFHHDPDANDTALDKRHQQLIAARPGSLTAREQMEINLLK